MRLAAGRVCHLGLVAHLAELCAVKEAGHLSNRQLSGTHLVTPPVSSAKRLFRARSSPKAVKHCVTTEAR